MRSVPESKPCFSIYQKSLSSVQWAFWDLSDSVCLVQLNLSQCRNHQYDGFVFPITQELYEKSLVRVVDESLPADLLEIKTFLTVPQVNTAIHSNLSFYSAVNPVV